jgi:hypothetical protein
MAKVRNQKTSSPDPESDFPINQILSNISPTVSDTCKKVPLRWK